MTRRQLEVVFFAKSSSSSSSLLLVIVLISVVLFHGSWGFPSGAGGCVGGRPAVETYHNAGLAMSGALENGGLILTLDGVALDRDVPTDFTIGVEHALKLSTTKIPSFRGVLFRLEHSDDDDNDEYDDEYDDDEDNVVVVDGALTTEDFNLRDANYVCQFQKGSVAGITHNGNLDKSTADVILRVDEVAEKLKLDMTVVIVNNRILSEHYYTRYILNAVDSDSKGSSLLRPSLSPTSMIRSFIPSSTPTQIRPFSSPSTAAPALHPDIIRVIDVPGERRPRPSWRDSYSVGDICYCNSKFDHGIGDTYVATALGNRTVREICAVIGKGPGRNGNPVYNDVQCGNGPANDAGDEDTCPGRVDLGQEGCGQIGPTWKLDGQTSFPSPSPTSAAPIVRTTSVVPSAIPSSYAGSARPSIGAASSSQRPSDIPSLGPTESTTAELTVLTALAVTSKPSDVPTVVPSITSPLDVPSLFPSAKFGVDGDSDLVILDPSMPPTSRSTPTSTSFRPSSSLTMRLTTPMPIIPNASSKMSSSVPTDTPSWIRSDADTMTPTDRLTMLPTGSFSDIPSGLPIDGAAPSVSGSSDTPSQLPSMVPTGRRRSTTPSSLTTSHHTLQPTFLPTGFTSEIPSDVLRQTSFPPSEQPSQSPSYFSSNFLSPLASVDATATPTLQLESIMPIVSLTLQPSETPSGWPGLARPPSLVPAFLFTPFPTTISSDRPSDAPSDFPSRAQLAVSHLYRTPVPSLFPTGTPLTGRSSSSNYPTRAHEIVALLLVHSNSTHIVRTPLTNHTVVDVLSTDTLLTIQAETTGQGLYVVFDLDGATYKIESFKPYHPDEGWQGYNLPVEGILTPGNHTVAATIYAGAGGGAMGATIAVGFVTIDTNLVVEAFVLIDATTNEDIGYIEDGDEFDINVFGNALNIRAETTAEVEAVVFDFDGTSRYKKEKKAPFSLGGDLKGDYNPMVELAVPGTHNLTATPRTERRRGVQGDSSSISFAIVNSTIIDYNISVNGLMLVNATTNLDIRLLVDNDVIDLAVEGRALNIRAVTYGPVASVIFDLDGERKFKKEKKEPFSLGDDPRGDYRPAEVLLVPGRHNLTATPHVHRIGRGKQEKSLTISFAVVE